jgi:hypothetical protein
LLVLALFILHVFIAPRSLQSTRLTAFLHSRHTGLEVSGQLGTSAMYMQMRKIVTTIMTEKKMLIQSPVIVKRKVTWVFPLTRQNLDIMQNRPTENELSISASSFTSQLSV